MYLSRENEISFPGKSVWGSTSMTFTGLYYVCA